MTKAKPTLIDIIESNIRIVGIYPVVATMPFEGVFTSFDKFHETLQDGDLDGLLGINGVDFEESDIPVWIENNFDPNVLFMQIETPVTSDRGGYSWGYTCRYWVKGNSLEELYKNALDEVNKKVYKDD